MTLRTPRLVVAAVAAVLVLGGSVLLISKDGHAAGSGIRGRITGGCIIEGCHPTPKVGLQLVRRWTKGVPEGRPFPLVERFRSAKDGTFTVPLSPGHYLIEQDPKSPAAGMMKPLEVYVRERKFTQVDPFYDVGMR